jgi:hypothetical protein
VTREFHYFVSSVTFVFVLQKLCNELRVIITITFGRLSCTPTAARRDVSDSDKRPVFEFMKTFWKAENFTVSQHVCLILALIILTPAQSSAQSNDLEKGLPNAFHCGDRDDLPMSAKDKACYWWTNSFNAQMLLGAAFNTALDPIFNGQSDPYWGQGAEGFAKRFGTRVAQSMTKGTGQALVGALFKEDPRFYVSRKDGFWPRFAFALTHTLIVKNDAGHEQLSAGRLAGAFSSGFVGMAWTPGPINTVDNALVRTGTAMGGVLAGSLWKEFQPDIMKLASSIFRRPPKATPATGATKP